MKDGVNNTRIRDVADFAKVDQPLVNYYFPSMNALYKEVFLSVLNHINDFMLPRLETQNGNSWQTLKSYCEAYVDWVAKHPGHSSVFLYFYYLTTVDELFLEMNKSIRATGRERISKFIYEGLEKKEFHLDSDIKVSELSWTIQGLITGMCVQAKTEATTDWTLVKRLLLKSVASLVGVKSA